MFPRLGELTLSDEGRGDLSETPPELIARHRSRSGMQEVSRR